VPSDRVGKVNSQRPARVAYTSEVTCQIFMGKAVQEDSFNLRDWTDRFA